MAWPREIQERYQNHREILLFADDRYRWVTRLYRARQFLIDGEDIFIIAGGYGPEAFSIPLPGGSTSVAEGWLALRRATGVPVLPAPTRTVPIGGYFSLIEAACAGAASGTPASD